MASDDFLFFHSPVSCEFFFFFLGDAFGFCFAGSSLMAGGWRHRRRCCSIRWAGFGFSARVRVSVIWNFGPFSVITNCLCGSLKIYICP